MSGSDTTHQFGRRSTVVRNVAITFSGSLLIGVLLYFAGGDALLQGVAEDEASIEDADPAMDGDLSEDREVDTGSPVSIVETPETAVIATGVDLQKLKESVDLLLKERLERQESEVFDTRTARSENILNRARRREAMRIGDAVVTEIDACQSEILQRDFIQNALDRPDIGCKVASLPKLVARYSALIRSRDHVDMASIQEPFETVFHRIRVAHENNDDSVIVRVEDVEFLRELLGRVGNARRSLSAYRQALGSILDSSKNLNSVSVTLSEAVDLGRNAEAMDYMDQLVRDEQDVKDSVRTAFRKTIAETDRHRWEEIYRQKLEEETVRVEQSQVDTQPNPDTPQDEPWPSNRLPECPPSTLRWRGS